MNTSGSSREICVDSWRLALPMRALRASRLQLYRGPQHRAAARRHQLAQDLVRREGVLRDQVLPLERGSLRREVVRRDGERGGDGQRLPVHARLQGGDSIALKNRLKIRLKNLLKVPFSRGICLKM